MTRELSSRSEYNIKDPYFHSSYQAMKNTRFRPRRLTQLLRKVNIRLPFNQLSVFKSHFVYFFSFKPPPSLHPVFFTHNLRFGLDSEQENGTLICSEPKNGFRLRALVLILGYAAHHQPDIYSMRARLPAPGNHTPTGALPIPPRIRRLKTIGFNWQLLPCK